ncbi:MAG: hypothetical protein HQ474_05225 [Flammeovirgaceae bacterium]|jgi:hypothetical protein|nr:hypothetical protein [Flammeovirgaceae bacterium]NQW27293.1 hypothetical protein [Flammeovirgaceae bacterium]
MIAEWPISEQYFNVPIQNRWQTEDFAYLRRWKIIGMEAFDRKNCNIENQ